MEFITYDIIFLVVFVLSIVIFLYIRRSHLKREGIMYLYRTNIGIKIIDNISRKYRSFLSVLQYLAVACGYILMVFVVYYFAKFSYNYLVSPTLAQTLKIPFLMPLIPYVDKFFPAGVLPPFYFTYWIIIIAVIAVPHEFAHGIFARLHNIKVKSTGFGFLGPFLAAFVEPDENQLNKSKKVSQLSILAAGTFANMIFAFIFALLLWAFFASAFVPSGIIFNTYSASIVNVSDIKSIDGIPIETMLMEETNQTLYKIKANNNTYFVLPEIFELTADKNTTEILVFDNSPAINAQLSGAIIEIDGKKITSYDDLNKTILSYKPKDKITVKTISSDEKEKSYSITLGERNGNPLLGIGFYEIPKRTGVIGFIYNSLSAIKDPLTYYSSSLGNFGFFVYHLLWWLVLINLSVAFFNMFPVGLFDGGRFFLLTVWGLTGSKKAGEIAFRITTWVFLILVALLMLKWFLIFF